jgi:protein-S-isoprenylcysteine O-methyltransferase Ste14
MCYAVVAYVSFVVVALWAIAFLADWPIVRTIDGRAARPAWSAFLVDAGLLLLFALQHSVMARDGFKQCLERLVPAPAERATYVLAASLVLALAFGEWRALPATIWRVDVSPWNGTICIVYAIGWVVAIAATFMIDHWDFLGLRQAARNMRRRPYVPPPFMVRWLYTWVRHPMMLGLVVAFWATPHMTAGHLLFAAGATAYIAVGIRFEERSLRTHLGSDYDDYAARVPAIVPLRRATREFDGVSRWSASDAGPSS